MSKSAVEVFQAILDNPKDIGNVRSWTSPDVTYVSLNYSNPELKRVIVRDHDKPALAYVYYENESGRRSSANLLTRDEAFLIAVNIAKLPSVPRHILKDIPRPPNSASRDD